MRRDRVGDEVMSRGRIGEYNRFCIVGTQKPKHYARYCKEQENNGWGVDLCRRGVTEWFTLRAHHDGNENERLDDVREDQRRVREAVSDVVLKEEGELQHALLDGG